MQGDFRLEVRTQGGAAIIAVRGELDLASSPALEAEIDRASAQAPRTLVLDLRELEFMDSTGLSVIVKAHQRLAEDGRSLCLVRGPQQVQRLLDLTGVAERIQVADTPDELMSGA